MVALYQNDGRGHFRDVTMASGFDRRGWGSGACVADIDNDGFEDVYITAFGADALWRNTGKGTFADVTRSAGVDETQMGHELRVRRLRPRRVPRSLRRQLRRVRRQDDSRARRRPPTAASWRPTSSAVRSGWPATLDVLYRNNGDGTFTDVTARAGVEGPRLLRLRRRVHRSQRRRVAGHLRGQRFGAEPALPQSRQRHVRRGRPACRAPP